jgi:phosphoglucosamine mutase
MTPEVALRLGRRHHVVASSERQARAARVVIGKDTRLSGYMLETALAAGVCAMGGRVMLTGPLPTPAIATSPSRCAPTRRRHQREPQPLRRQRHQDLRARRLQAPRRRVEAEIEALIESDALAQDRPCTGERRRRAERSTTRAAATSRS